MLFLHVKFYRNQLFCRLHGRHCQIIQTLFYSVLKGAQILSCQSCYFDKTEKGKKRDKIQATIRNQEFDHYFKQGY